MEGRGLDQEETPPPLLTINSSLIAPKTPETIAAGNYIPVGAGLTAPVASHGHGVWSVEPAGEYFARRPCPPSTSPVPPRRMICRST